MQVVSLSLFRFDSLASRIWVFGQMGFARLPLSRTEGLSFFKLFGSGTGEGFTPVPNPAVWAILCVWSDQDCARRAIAESPVFRRWRARSSEAATIFLSATGSRGLWSGRQPFEVFPVAQGNDHLPIAVLTRATLKKRHVVKFWRRQPDISALIREQEHLLFKIGVGEVPWVQQVTFSVWDDAVAMKAFAYRSASHGGAVKQVRQNGWFREELYARFRVLGAEGRWEGADFATRIMPRNGAVALQLAAE
jgi:spheroidene monooxygenase